MPYIARYTVNYRGSMNRRMFYICPDGMPSHCNNAVRFQTKDEARHVANFVERNLRTTKQHKMWTWEILEVEK